MTKRKIAICFIATLAALAIGICTGVIPVDSIGRRRRVSREIDSLAETARLHPEDERYAKQLLKIANGNYSFAASHAAGSLGEIGEAAKPVLHEMAELLNSPNPFVEREIALAFEKLGPLSAPVLQSLEEKVAQGTGDGACFSAQAIGKIGLPAVRSLPLLRRRLGSVNPTFDDSLKRAISALEKVERDAANDCTLQAEN